MLQDPNAAGRPYILHTSDEPGNEEDPATPYTDDPPSHIIGYRTAAAKLGLYSDWTPGTTTLVNEGQESELYEYSTAAGQQEIDNLAPGGSALYDQLYAALVEDAIPNELRQPVPAYLQATQQQAYSAYLADFGGGGAQVYLPAVSRGEK